MKIDKAIAILKRKHPPLAGMDDQNGQDAIKLGIEALVRIRDYRDTKFSIPKMLLPSETKD